MPGRRQLLVALLVFAASVGAVGGASAVNQRFRAYFSDRWVEYFERDGLAISEGDIVLGTARELAALRDAPPNFRKALAVTRAEALWPPGPSGVHEVPYTVEAGSNVAQAIASFNATFPGVIQWVPRTTQRDFVSFNLANLANNTSGSCYSALGRIGGRQEIGGNTDCLVWQLLHEMGHAIGLYHTHQAVSAKQFVKVLRSTIDPVRRYLYDPLYDSKQIDGYDYMSVMHYEYHDSSVTPDRYTMASIPAGIDLGNSSGYSAGDIDSIRRLYGAAAATVTIATNPPGLDVVVDGQRRTTPLVVDWGLGSSHQIDVPNELQTKDNFRFAFGRWSHDGSAKPASAQQWIVEPETDFAGRATNFPRVGVLTANFIRLLDIQQYLVGGSFGQFSLAPEAPPWPGTPSHYPQLTKFALAASPNAGYMNYWYWEAADTITGGAGGSSQASLRVRADLPAQAVGGGFFSAPGIAIRMIGDGVDGSLRSIITFPDSSQKSVALPWAFKTPAGTYKVSVPPVIGRSESVRFALQGIDGLDNPATGAVTTPAAGQGTKVVTVTMQKQIQPVVQVNPPCAGTITLSPAAQWLPVGASLSATARPVGAAIFTGWSGTAAGANPTVSVVANEVPELIANFNSIQEPFTLSSASPAQFLLGHGQSTFELAGTGFTQVTYVILDNAITRSPQFIDSHTLRVTLSDADFPAQADLSISLGTQVAGECYGFTGAVGVTAVAPNQVGKALAYEYYNAALDHYFITWLPEEISKLDTGTTIKGWTRTGQSFATLTIPQAATSAVCRIYIPPGKGDGHYFGRAKTECDGTMAKNPTFILESPAFFYLYPPNLGACAVGTVPVYRVFSNRADANHRYTTDRATRDQMVAKGWLAEGDGPDAVVMCAPQ